MKYIIVLLCLFICSASRAQLSVTGTLEATAFTGTGLTINGDMKGYTLVLTGTLSAASFSGTYTGTVLTPSQTNITALGVLSNISVSGQVETGNISTTSITGVGGLLKLRETGGEYGEAGLLIYNKTGSNGPIFYTNPTNNTIDLVDFGFLSQASNSQTNMRFEHRSASWLDAGNTNGEMQFFHITNNGAAATPATAFTGIGSAVTTINSTSAIKLNGGTGPSTFATSGAGTLLLGGAASTGNLTFGSSSGTQTVAIGNGAGNAIINIGVNSANAEVTLSGASIALGSGVRVGNGRFSINKPIAPTTGLTANTVATVTQIMDAGIIGFNIAATRTLTLPSAATATGLVQNLPGTPQVGDVFSFVVFNLLNGIITLTAGTGTTIAGPGSIAATVSGNSRTFYCRVTSIANNAELITCY